MNKYQAEMMWDKLDKNVLEIALGRDLDLELEDESLHTVAVRVLREWANALELNDGSQT